MILTERVSGLMFLRDLLLFRYMEQEAKALYEGLGRERGYQNTNQSAETLKTYKIVANCLRRRYPEGMIK